MTEWRTGDHRRNAAVKQQRDRREEAQSDLSAERERETVLSMERENRVLFSDVGTSEEARQQGR